MKHVWAGGSFLLECQWYYMYNIEHSCCTCTDYIADNLVLTFPGGLKKLATELSHFVASWLEEKSEHVCHHKGPDVTVCAQTGRIPSMTKSCDPKLALDVVYYVIRNFDWYIQTRLFWSVLFCEALISPEVPVYIFVVDVLHRFFFWGIFSSCGSIGCRKASSQQAPLRWSPAAIGSSQSPVLWCEHQISFHYCLSLCQTSIFTWSHSAFVLVYYRLALVGLHGVGSCPVTGSTVSALFHLSSHRFCGVPWSFWIAYWWSTSWITAPVMNATSHSSYVVRLLRSSYSKLTVCLAKFPAEQGTHMRHNVLFACLFPRDFSFCEGMIW